LGLRAAAADARSFRIERVAQDSVTGTVILKPDQAGTTSLAVIANGMRQYLTVTVPPRAAPGPVDCRWIEFLRKFRLPQVRRLSAREPRQAPAGSSAKRCRDSLRGAWGNFLSIGDGLP